MQKAHIKRIKTKAETLARLSKRYAFLQTTVGKRQRPTKNHSSQWLVLQDTKHFTKERIG